MRACELQWGHWQFSTDTVCCLAIKRKICKGNAPFCCFPALFASAAGRFHLPEGLAAKGEGTKKVADRHEEMRETSVLHEVFCWDEVVMTEQGAVTVAIRNTVEWNLKAQQKKKERKKEEAETELIASVLKKDPKHTRDTKQDKTGTFCLVSSN